MRPAPESIALIALWPLKALPVPALAFLLGLCLSLGWAIAREPRIPDANAPVEVWISDRDANRVVGLDRNLLPLRSVALRAPLDIEARTDGGAWVISAVHSDPLGPHLLTRLNATGSSSAEFHLAPVLDLAVDPHGRALVIELEPAGERLRIVDDSGASIWTRAWPGALSIAGSTNRVLVGTASGGLALFDPASPATAPRLSAFGGVLSDVAAGPLPGTWWVLDAAGSCRVALLDSLLAVMWSKSVGLHALHLAPVAGRERVWIADSTQPHVRRFGPGGVLEVDRADLPQSGLDRACAWRGDSALFTTPGALLHLDGGGQGSPGQAGFDFLVDVSALR